MLRAEDALDGIGFDVAEIDELLAAQESAAQLIEDPRGPKNRPKSPSAARATCGCSGNHRLLCGDSRASEDLERLMAGETAAPFSTDPPYCVDYTGNDRPVHEGRASGKDLSHVYREVDIEDLGEFLDATLSACLSQVAQDAAVYMWHAHVQQPTIAAAFERHGILLHQVLVWVKPVATFGHSYYCWKSRPPRRGRFARSSRDSG